VSRFTTLVLVVRDHRLEVVADAPRRARASLEPVGRPQELVVGVGEVQLDLARERLARVELRAVVDDLVHRVAQGREVLARVEQVVPERRDPGADSRRRPLLDVLLELVDLVVDPSIRSR